LAIYIKIEVTQSKSNYKTNAAANRFHNFRNHTVQIHRLWRKMYSPRWISLQLT